MLKILKSGLFTTIQDKGRYGYLNKGVPVAGYMDSFSATKVNMLLENDSESAVMEITMTGPTLQFEEETYICIGGAKLSATLNNAPIQSYKVIKISKGDIAGLFFKQGKLDKGELGTIELKQDCAFVAVSRLKTKELIKALNNTKLKKKKVRISLLK